MLSLFQENIHLIVFLHVFAAVVWVGGMIIIRFVVHPSLANIVDKISRLEMSLKLMRKLFWFMVPFIVIVFLTAWILWSMMSSVEPQETTQWMLIKGSVLGLMLLNYLWMIKRRNNAYRMFKNTHFPKAKETLSIIPQYLLPLNIILGLIALYFGVSLRGL